MKSASSFLESPSKIRTENYVHTDALVNEDKKKERLVSVSVHGPNHNEIKIKCISLNCARHN
jgi:hypothetical protein